MRGLRGNLYEFGPFRLDTADRMLLREGQYVPLAPKVLETLLTLVEHRGHILEKEDLLREIWPNTFVEEVSLAKNVSTLRKALGETEEQRYIETIPKRGYRFVAEVRAVGNGSDAPPRNGHAALPAPEATPSPPPDATVSSAEKRGIRWWTAGVLAALSAGALVWHMEVADRSRTPAASSRVVPLTSYPGHENQAAFSPQGDAFAFVWDGLRHEGLHLYVKKLGSETPVQLTRGPGSDSKPAWSPDGRLISFLRASGEERAWYEVPASGGAERKLAEVFPYFDLGNGNSPYGSPDGKFLAIVDKSAANEPASIFLLSLATLERRRLTAPPPGTTGDYFPAYSPDGKNLAFARAASFSATDLYVMRLPDGKPKRLTNDGLTIEGLTWTADGREIIFSSRRGGSINSLWRIAANGGEPERVSTVGKDVISPALAPHGNRLAYTQSLDDMNIWGLELSESGQPTAKRQIIASTFRDSDPAYAPDGRRIAFASGRSGGFGIWVCNRDGTDPRLLFDGGAYVSGSPRWSPDGRWLAFDSRFHASGKGGVPEVYLVNAKGGGLRRLTSGPGGAVAPSWSHDGRWIYFGSTQTGRMEIWKALVAGDAAIQITQHGGFEAFETEDGRYLYYLRARTTPGIWRVPSGGGEEVALPQRNQAGLWRSWGLAGHRIYYTTAMPPLGARVEFLDLTTGATREIAPITGALEVTIPGLAVSADGRSLLYAQYDESGSDIMMIETFR